MSDPMNVAIIETLDAKEVFTGDNPTLRTWVDKVIKAVDDFNGDVTTPDGRDEIKKIAYKVVRSKTALDKLGKDFVAEIKAKTKSIDDQRKGMRETLEALQERVRRPLTEWEEAEKRREEALKEVIRVFTHRSQHTGTDIDWLVGELERSEETVVDESFGALQEMAQEAKDKAIEHLSRRIDELNQREAERAELEELRSKNAEREKKEAAQREAEAARARAERAEDVAKAREDQIKADADRRAQDAAQQAEKDKIAAVEAEKKRAADEKARDDAAEAKRAANKKHHKKINGAALDALVAVGLSKEAAQTAVEAIARGQVPNVTIRY